MLHRLGRKLTLLNLLISGAILLVMALVVLGISERQQAEKYENDLYSFSNSTLSVMLSDVQATADANFYVQSGGQYIVAREDADSQLYLLTRSAVDTAAVQRAAEGLRIRLNDQLAQPQVYMVEIRMDELLESANSMFLTVTGVEITEDSGVAMQESPASGSGSSSVYTTGDQAYAFSSTIGEHSVTISDADLPTELEQEIVFSAMQTTQELTDLSGTPYRILATMIYDMDNMQSTALPAGDMLLVMQDRTEELHARNEQRLLFLLLVLGGMALIFLGSRFLSSRSIRPIEQSIRQQREFVAAASHELRTPIAAIRANAEVLEDASLHEDFLPFLQSIQSEGHRMTRLVGDLIDLARADAGEWQVTPVPVSVQDTLLDAAQLIAPLCEKAGLSLHTGEIPDVFVSADPERLRQVLMALLDNALCYTPAGGEIWLDTEESAHHVSMRVSDSGIGIADDIKPRIFDRFYRADAARSRSHEGAGLGLSVAREWASHMGGTIAVADRPGGGSIFTVRFTKVDPPQET